LQIKLESDFKVRYVQQSQVDGYASSKSSSQVEAWKRFALVAVTYSVLIVLLSVFPRFPILIPTPWTTGIIFFYLAPLFLYSISTMIRPWMVVTICFPSICLGELLWCAVYGCTGELIVNVIIALSSWGIGCLLISILRNRNEAMAMLIGALWGFIGLLVPALVYYTMILYWNSLYMVAISLLTMTLNLAVIPAAITLNHLLRRVLKIKQLEELLLLNTTSR